MQPQTAFETERGVSAVVLSRNHALVVVSEIDETELTERRIHAMRTLSQAGCSIDFLKLSLDGFSFVVPEEQATAVREALCGAGFEAKALTGRAMITVKAVNIRGESGLVARIAQTVVESGAAIESLGDMHSSVLLIVDERSAEGAVAALRQLISNGEKL